MALFAADMGRRTMQEASAPEVSPEITEAAKLVSAACNGDRDAFGRLYARYAPMVHGVLLAKVPANEVDDLVQDVFLKALRQLSALREPGSFGAWIATIARNRANDYHRRSVPEEPLDEEVPESDASSFKSAPVPAAAVLDIIRGLPEAYRETLILRLVEGMTGPEIAARTGLTHGSVRVNLHRGMEMLRAKLEPNRLDR